MTSTSKPGSRRSGAPDDAFERHHLELFDTAEELAVDISRVLGIALDQGHGVMSIATAQHQHLIDQQLELRGISLAAARIHGQYTVVDAGALLSRVLVKGEPDAEVFGNVMESLLEPLFARFHRVVIYGELVAVLWDQGASHAAVSLEKLLTRFLKPRPVILHCGYPHGADLDPDRVDHFREICSEHCRALQEGDLRKPSGKNFTPKA